MMSLLVLRTPPVNSTLPVGARTPCGALPLCVEWPRLPPPGACRPTPSFPRVPHTFPAASIAHQVSEQDWAFQKASATNEILSLSWAIFFLLIEQEGKGRLPPALRPPPPRPQPLQMTSPSSPYQPTRYSPVLLERYDLPSERFPFKQIQSSIMWYFFSSPFFFIVEHNVD